MKYFIAELNHKGIHKFYRLFVYKDESLNTIVIDNISSFIDIDKLVKRLSSSLPNDINESCSDPVKISNRFSNNLFNQYKNAKKFNSLEEIVKHYPEYLI